MVCPNFWYVNCYFLLLANNTRLFSGLYSLIKVVDEYIAIRFRSSYFVYSLPFK